MKQSFAVQEIILQRKKHIDYLKKTLAKTTTHTAQISILKEISNEEVDLEVFTESEEAKNGIP